MMLLTNERILILGPLGPNSKALVELYAKNIGIVIVESYDENPNIVVATKRADPKDLAIAKQKKLQIIDEADLVSAIMDAESAEEPSDHEISASENVVFKGIPQILSPKGELSENDIFLIFATNKPETIISDDFSCLVDGQDVGSLEPPTGVGENILTQEQMDDEDGVLDAGIFLSHEKEALSLLKKYFDVCAIENKKTFETVTEKDFIERLKSDAFKYVRVVHLESEG